MDVAGYQAYTIQQDGTSRHATAFGGQSATSGAVTAGVAATGGPRNRFFTGAFFERTGTYTLATGEVVYTGRYVGLTNLDNAGGDLIAPPAGLAPELVPTQAAAVQGDVALRANFADSLVEGNIFNRSRVEAGTPLPSIVLVSTGIETDGTFDGSVEYDLRDPSSGATTPTVVGSYGGIFGGTGATEVAGAVTLSEFDGVGNPLGLENELETGIFVLDR